MKRLFFLLLAFVSLAAAAQSDSGKTKLYQLTPYTVWPATIWAPVTFLSGNTWVTRLYPVYNFMHKNDTAAMLAPYLKAAQAAALFQPLGNYATAGQLGAKLAATDTLAMLAPYLRTAMAAALYQPVGSYAAANHNHSGVYQPVGSYLTSEADPKRVTAVAFTGGNTKTLTVTLADGSTVSNTFADFQGSGSGGTANNNPDSLGGYPAGYYAPGANRAVLDRITAAYRVADSTKLDGIAAGATANRSDAATDALFLTKVDKITGKKLSTKDYTAADSLKLAGLQNGWPKDSATKYITDSISIITPAWTAVNANYALTKLAPRITVDASAGAVSITLPSLPTGAGTDYLINVINNTNPVTIIGSVEGATNAIIRQKGVVILSADVSTYRMLHAAIIPRGGSTNQVLAKASSSDYDVAWTTPVAGGGSSGGGLTDDYLVADNSTAQSIPYGCYCWSTPSAGTVTVQGATSWNWDGSKGTAPHSGLYRINFNVWFGDNVPSINIGTALQINSTGVYNQLWEMHARTDGSNRHSVSYQTEVYLTAGQTVEPKIYWEGDGWGIQAVHFAVIRER